MQFATHVHLPKISANDPDCVQAYCERCKMRVHIRAGDKKGFAKFFKRDTLKPHENLYYEEYPHKMDVIHT